MARSAFVRIAVAVLLLVEVVAGTLYVATRIGPFAALLGVAGFGTLYFALQVRRSRVRRTPSAP